MSYKDHGYNNCHDDDGDNDRCKDPHPRLLIPWFSVLARYVRRALLFLGHGAARGVRVAVVGVVVRFREERRAVCGRALVGVGRRGAVSEGRCRRRWREGEVLRWIGRGGIVG